MPFYFRHSDKQLDLEDLPLDRWITIQDKTGRQWHEVLGANILGDVKVSAAVVAECAAHLGIEVPTPSLRQMLEMIVFVQSDNLPAEYQDGIPDPKAAGTEPATI
jgi:hypothetical protein